MLLKLSLLIKENEDLVQVLGDKIYPLQITYNGGFANLAVLEKYYPYLPFTKKFTSDMFMGFTDILHIENPKLCCKYKTGLLLAYPEQEISRVPRKFNRSEMFS